MAKEQWRDVVGFESIYEVSNHGLVRRIAPGPRTEPGLVLKPFMHRGYARVTLCKGGVDYCRQVHRLVAAAFIGPCPVGYQVNHKSGDPSDNRLSNLEYVTPKQNTQHSIVVLGNSFVGERSPNSKLTKDDVYKIRRMLREGLAHREIATRFGVSRPTVTAISTGRNWSQV